MVDVENLGDKNEMKPYPGLATATTSSWRDSGVRNILENSFFVFYYNLWFFVRQTFVFLTLRSVEQFLTLHSFKRWRCVNIIMFFFFFFFLVPQNFFLNWLFLLSLKIRYVVGRRWQKIKINLQTKREFCFESFELGVVVDVFFFLFVLLLARSGEEVAHGTDWLSRWWWRNEAEKNSAKVWLKLGERSSRPSCCALRQLMRIPRQRCDEVYSGWCNVGDQHCKAFYDVTKHHFNYGMTYA